MKKLILLFFVSAVILFFSCKKKDNAAEPTPFSYTSLVASESIIPVTSSLHIVATATGDDLQYSWKSVDSQGNNFGNIIGSGSDIQWTICHADTFIVSCTVSDKYGNSETKSVNIRSTL
jgi:hypothetical protein